MIYKWHKQIDIRVVIGKIWICRNNFHGYNFTEKNVQPIINSTTMSPKYVRLDHLIYTILITSFDIIHWYDEPIYKIIEVANIHMKSCYITIIREL